ncbi:MAG: hydroxymethylpyrimidine/phosphomethylpyrimidine kinase [Burkholderiaceae bacterium]|nr:hydroxymethylpyrimidine/phosphomethylpyrimidine kinase [Burkholderiaceae bacterium]MCD8517840.1 hydroxymethylpyrimidine/phosphomethylpyrimidine kinase [Burkholderiaceae bacterium]MCD8564620.1 hydroxymethylpyrimidine/phosphomethylpyrimidine kinase [Burkholderiaceae bacterium]
MPVATPPTVLVFGLFDPTGRTDIPADSITCAAHGTHALCVPTGMAVSDTAGIHALDRGNAEQVDEQARCLLEDMPVAALKVGTVMCPEVSSVIASVAADYSDAPLVLQLGPQENPGDVPDQDMEGGEVAPSVGATLELLVPQASVVVMPASAMSRWLNDEVLNNFNPADGPSALLALGATWALVTGFAQRPGSLVNLLLGPEGETIALPCEPGSNLPQRIQDLSGLTATALACGLAQGMTVIDSAKLACDYAELAARRAFQAGMGQKLANRHKSGKP